MGYLFVSNFCRYTFALETKTNNMTRTQFTKIATNKMNALTTTELKHEAKKLMNVNTYEANIVHEVIMDILCERMNDVAFIEFCNELN